MPWQMVSVMDQRREFVRLALEEGVKRRKLCRRFGIHSDKGYKWLERWTSGERELADHSRRPRLSPVRTQEDTEARILALRDLHPAWGARKIAHCFRRGGLICPAVSTVHEILRRNGRIIPALGGPVAHQRFEKEAPNLLWQMDSKAGSNLAIIAAVILSPSWMIILAMRWDWKPAPTSKD